jgi:ribosomal-protein-alanine N-acetyltransferase
VTSKDWPPLPESIQTPRLLLRRFRLADANDVFAYAQDPEWGRFLITIEPPYERRHADAFVASQVLMDWRTEHSWALEHEGRVVGGLGLRPVHRHARAELGYSLARWLWGRGLMTEAVSVVIDEAFRRLPIRRISAIAIAENVRSTRLMEKVGMQREALLRQHRIQHGQTFDEAHYGLLREEWEQRAGAAPSERDASG